MSKHVIVVSLLNLNV